MQRHLGPYPVTPQEEVPVPGPRWFDDVSIGDRLPLLLATPDTTQLFFFSAATVNGHRIHYDRSWAVGVEHHEDVLVQGPLQAALLGRLVTDWMAPHGRLLQYSYEHRSSAFPGQRLRFTGLVTDRTPAHGHGEVRLGLSAETDDGRLLIPGSAVVALPYRSRARKPGERLFPDSDHPAVE